MKHPDQDEQGSALALVLILITLLSTLLISIAFLTQSAARSVNTESVSSDFRSAVVGNIFQQVISDCFKGTPNSGNCRSDNFGSRVNSCSVINGNQNPNNSNGMSYRYPTVDPRYIINVDCDQSPTSGDIYPLASYILAGTGCVGTSCSSNPGVDGGLKLIGSGSCFPLKLNGGLLNVSGVWSGVSGDSCGISLEGTKSILITPTASAPSVATCPAATFGQICGCPSGYSSEQCPRVNSFDSLNPANTLSSVNSYLRFIGTKVSTRVSSVTTPAEIIDCTMSQGVIDSTLLAVLNTKTGDRTLCPSFTLTGGIYRFTAENYDEVERSEWKIQDAVAVTSTAPTMLIFEGNSILNVDSGSLILTTPFEEASGSSPLPPSTSPTIAFGENSSAGTSFYGSSSTISWNGFSRPAIRIGGNGEIATPGIIYAPAGYGEFLSQSGARFQNAVVLKAVTISQNSPAFSSTVSGPPLYNGDRLVRLRFRLLYTDNQSVTQDDPLFGFLLCKPGQASIPLCDSETNGVLNLGVIELQILDSFGTRPRNGFIIRSWDAP